jgi:Winged helix DNA-binding domain
MSAAELAIASRLAQATRSDVRAALWQDRSLVRTYGPRGTVHLLPARDLDRWVGALSQLAAAPTGFPPDVRLTPEQAEEVVAAIAGALSGATLTIDELSAEVVRRTGPWAGEEVMPAFQGMWPRWRQVMQLAGMRGALCFGPVRGRKVTYTSPRRLLPGFSPAAEGPALSWAVRSYLHAYGPSTPERFANWLAIPASRGSEIFDSLAGELQQVDIEGRPAWVSAGDIEVPPDPPGGVRLLAYFDGYAYRVGIHAPELLFPGPTAGLMTPGGFQYIVVDGIVAGRWHQRRSGRRIDITAEPLIQLTAAQRADLDEQADRVAAIMEGEARLAIGTVPVGGHA